MPSEDSLLSVHLTEYEKIREEICLRIQLQNKIIGSVLVLSGAALAAVTAWVLKSSDDKWVSLKDIIVAGETNSKGIVVLVMYVAGLELLICTWIYHLWRALDMHAYLTSLDEKIKTTLCINSNANVLGYQFYNRKDGTPQGPEGIGKSIKYLQPAPIYGLAFISLFLLSYLCCCGFNWCADWFWSGICAVTLPVVLITILLFLLRLHFRILKSANMSTKDG